MIPLGGCGEFGMNLTAFLTAGKLFVVDCGVRFPGPASLGIDAILPDVDPWFREAGGVFAYVITHGHEDHLGALPHILPRWPAPVYGTGWTIELLKIKLQRLGLDPKTFKLIVVEPGDRVATDGFSAEYVHVNHSIPMTCALMIRTPSMNIFHTGDFKFESKPIIEAPVDFSQLDAFAREGIDLLLADSTNAAHMGPCPSEESVFEPLRQVVDKAKGAVVVTTFASNLWRLKTLTDIAVATGRKIFVMGNGFEQTLILAKTTGLFHMPENLRLAEAQLGTWPRHRLLVLATGCQGEWRSGLARLAQSESKVLTLAEGDTVIFSSRVIPGNEKQILAMINAFQRLGVQIVTPREVPAIHVSGHAYGGDLERLVATLKPRRFVPIHGAFGQLLANAGRPARAGVKAITGVIESGEILDISPNDIRLAGRIQVALNFVDADAGVVIPYETLRERLRIGELGAALVSGVYDRSMKSWLVPPDIEFVGFDLPFGVDKDAWIERLGSLVESELPSLLEKKGLPPRDAVEEIRVLVRRKLFATLRKKPVVSIKLHVIQPP